ncbi:MAG: multicopper oxidase domain-containing protein [Chloroflexi bacterium]|nr:multicopper oxidase domain-containing protein [Chloroflexota bacterium]
MMLTRRELLKLGLSAAATVPLGRLLIPDRVLAHGDHGGGSGGSSPPTTPFAVPLPIPPVLVPSSTDATTDYYQITMRPAQMQIIPGLWTTIWGYNGLYPGPTIVARSGRRVVIRQTNNLPEPSSVHLHGGHTPPDSDGHPTATIAPGAYRDYIYPNNQIAAPLWYHEHADGRTPQNVYKGLAGFYILTDDFEAGLNLPSGAYDVGLAIQDKQFNADGSLFYPEITGDVLKNGFLGDKLLVNAAIQPFFKVANRKYCFRLLNGSNARDYELALSSGAVFKQIGTDGGLRPAPITRSTIPIAPGERIDVVIDFKPFPVGTKIVLKNNKGSGDTADVMRFDVDRTESDTSSLPATLRPLPSLPAATKTRDIELDFDRGLDLWVLNGKPFDPARIDAFPKLGSTELWRFKNRSRMMHPLHLHDVQFQVVARDGGLLPGDVGWKDTVPVESWDSVSVKVQFLDFTGTYVYHCHILEHEDHAMMGQFQVVP